MIDLYKALAKAKQEIGKISKDSTNPFFKSKYFDINQLLEHVEPILHKNGLLLVQPILGGVVTTIVTHTETGKSIKSELELPDLTDPQKLLACITYYRRGTLQSLLAIQAEDDDGNKASKPTVKKDDGKPWLNPKTKQWTNAVEALQRGKLMMDIEKIYKISKENKELLILEAS